MESFSWFGSTEVVTATLGPRGIFFFPIQEILSRFIFALGFEEGKKENLS